MKLKRNHNFNSNFYIIKSFKCQQYCVRVCYRFVISGHAFEAISNNTIEIQKTIFAQKYQLSHFVKEALLYSQYSQFPNKRVSPNKQVHRMEIAYKYQMQLLNQKPIWVEFLAYYPYPKSLQSSPAVGDFYGTGIEILAGFGQNGRLSCPLSFKFF